MKKTIGLVLWAGISLTAGYGAVLAPDFERQQRRRGRRPRGSRPMRLARSTARFENSSTRVQPMAAPVRRNWSRRPG